MFIEALFAIMFFLVPLLEIVVFSFSKRIKKKIHKTQLKEQMSSFKTITPKYPKVMRYQLIECMQKRPLILHIKKTLSIKEMKFSRAGPYT